MQHLTSFLILISILALTGCDSSSSKSDPQPMFPTSPSGTIPAGLNVKQTIRFVPSEFHEPGKTIAFIAQPGRKPVQIIFESSLYFTLNSSNCDADGCTIEYTQKLLSLGSLPTVSYYIRDEQGQNWLSGTLSSGGPIPQLGTYRYQPVFNQLNTIKFPVTDAKGLPLQAAPEVHDIIASGGEVQSFVCTSSECTVNFLYKSSSDPKVWFKLATTEMSTRALSIDPVPEVITYKDVQKAIYGSRGSFRLTEGVDYDSSWKKPASWVSFSEIAGTSTPLASCNNEACVVTLSSLVTQGAHVSYSIGNTPTLNKGRIDIKSLEFDLKILVEEIAVDHRTPTTITFRPGVDYTSVNGALAESIAFNTFSSDLQLGRVVCDREGVCQFTALYTGFETFTALDYTVTSNGVTTAKQTLKVIPKLYTLTSDLEVWNDKKEFVEVTLAPGKDYISADGSLAQSVTIDSSRIKFKDANPFVCDASGVCRAEVPQSADYKDLTYTLTTTSGLSRSTRRWVSLKRDSMIWNNKLSKNRISSGFDANFDSFEIELQRDRDYTSQFPAETISTLPVSSGNAVVIDRQSCDAEGTCLLKGKYLTSTGSLSVYVNLANRYGNSESFEFKMIREKHKDILPNRTSYAPGFNGTALFVIPLQAGVDKGYTSKNPIAQLRIVTHPSLIGGTTVTADGVSYQEYPCGAEGTCAIPLKALESSTTLSYRLVDDAGQTSVLTPIKITFPSPLAFDKTSIVPADNNEVTFSFAMFASTDPQTLEFDAVPGVTVNTSFASPYHKVTLHLDKPLEDGQTLPLTYRIRNNGRVSPSAVLTVKAAPLLKMKQGLIIPAVEQTDGTWQLTLSYPDHFEALSAGTRLYRYFDDSALTLTFAKPNSLVQKSVVCDLSEKCVFTFFRLPETGKTEAVVLNRYDYISLATFVRETPFTLSFE